MISNIAAVGINTIPPRFMAEIKETESHLAPDSLVLSHEVISYSDSTKEDSVPQF